MIILLTMLYAFLASGGYLESLGSWQNFGSWENISSGLFNLQNAESTTTTSITLQPIQKQTQKVQNKINSKRVPRKNINNVLISNKIPVKTRILIRQRRPTTKPIGRNGTKSSTRAPTTKIHTTTLTIPMYKDTIEIVELEDSDVMQQINAISDTTTDIPLQSSHVTKYIEKCPEEGFFFKNDLQSANPVCYLCFCKENTTAVCWPRDNRRCDAESYQHNLARIRLSRNRRSFNFGNLFMQDAARVALNANGKKQCKPGEASYSVGCPPEDWCVGCTVCDCDVNAKWNCHLLSFCTDDNKTKQNKKGHQTPRPYDPFTTPKAWRAQRKLAQEAVQKLAEKMAAERKKKAIGKDNSRRYFFKNGTLVNKTMFDLRKRKKSPSIFNQTSAEVQKFNDVNMKIRKIPDEIQKQMMIDRQQNNARKVSESANFLVRKMPNQKTKQNIVWKQTEAVNLLSKREPQRKKKRQVILPSGYKLPKEILDKLPEGVIPPSNDSPDDHIPKKFQVKRVLKDKKISVTKPPKKMITKIKEFKNSFQLPSEGSKKVLVKRSTKLEQPKHKFKKPTGKQLKGPGALIQRNKQTTINNSQNKESKGKLGLKERSKKRNLSNINKKISEKRNTKTTKNANILNTKKGSEIKTKSKEHSVKRSVPNNKKKSSEKRNLKTNKNINNLNTKKDNEIKPNLKSKTSNNRKPDKKMSLTSKAKTTRKNFKTTIPKKNNNQNNKVTKVIPKPKVVVKKSIQNEKETKIIITNNNRKKNAVKRDKNVNNYNPLTKLGNSSVRKSNIHGPKVINTRNKRSNNSKKTAKANNIDRKRLNEHINKLTTNAQANLNRRVLEAVGDLLGMENLNQQSKKVKRSAIVNKNSLRGRMSDELISDISIEFPPPVLIAPNKNIEHSIDNGDYEDVNQTFSVPFIGVSEEKVKRFAIKHDTNFEKLNKHNIMAKESNIVIDKGNYNTYDSTHRSIMKKKANRNKREISTNSSQVILNVITTTEKLKTIDVQMHINISSKNKISEMNANIPKETAKESSSTVVDKPVVIKNDNTFSTKNPLFLLNTEHYMELNNLSKRNNSSTDFIIPTTQYVRAYGNEKSLVYSNSFSKLTTSPVIININISHGIINTSLENSTKYNDEIKYNENLKIVKENKYKPKQLLILQIHKNNSTKNESSENNLQYKFNTNSTLKQQSHTTRSLTTSMINKQTKQNTNTTVNEHLKRKLETKIFNFDPTEPLNFNQTVTVSFEPKQSKILQNNRDMNNKFKPNYNKKEVLYPYYPDGKAVQRSQDYTATSLAANIDSIKSFKVNTNLVKTKNKKVKKQMRNQRKAQAHGSAKQKSKLIQIGESQNKNSRGEPSVIEKSKNKNTNMELSEKRKKKTNKNRTITKNGNSKKTNPKSKAKSIRKTEQQMSKLSYLNNAKKGSKGSKNIFSNNQSNHHRNNFTKVISKHQAVNRRNDSKNNFSKNNNNYRKKNYTDVLPKHEDVTEKVDKYKHEQMSKLTNFNDAKKARKDSKNIFTKINYNYHKKNVTKVIAKKKNEMRRKDSKSNFSKNNNNYRKKNYTKVLSKNMDVIERKDLRNNLSNYRKNNETEELPKHYDVTEKSTKEEKRVNKLKANKRKKNANTTDKNLKINKPLIKLGRHFFKKPSKRGLKFVSNADKWSDIAKKPNIIERKRLKGEIKEINANDQANVTRRVFEAEGNITEQDMDQLSRKVKRSAILNKKIAQEKNSDEIISDSSIEFPLTVLKASNLSKGVTKKNIENQEQEDENQTFSLPFIRFPGQKVKRFVSTSIVEKSSEPPHEFKVQFDKRKNKVYNTTTNKQFNYEEANRDLIDTYIPKESTEINANDQVNLTRRAFEPEGNITEQDTDQLSKKIKRSTIFNKKIGQERISDEFISDSSIEFPLTVLIASNLSHEGYEKSVENEKQENENQTFNLPSIGFPGQKVKRFVTSILEKSSEPLYKSNVQFDKRKNKVNKTTTHKVHKQFNHEEVNRDLIDTYIPKESTESRLFKRLSPLVKKVHMKKSKQNGKGYKTKSKNYSIKKSQMINVSIVKSKLNRTKREISTNTSRIISPVITALDKQATDSIFDYYKYTLDDFTKTSDNTGNKHLTDFFEVNSKTTAAKRSIDTQLQGAKIDAHQMTETISVQGLKENINDSSANILDIPVVLGRDESLKVHPGESQVLKPTDILDNRVVIIEDQNMSSTEKFNPFVMDTILPITKHNFEPNSLDITVIAVKKHENMSSNLNNSNEEINANIPKDYIEKGSGIVDTTIVIINDQNYTVSKNTLPVSLNTEYNLSLHNTTKINTNKDELFIITTENIKANDNEKNFSNVSTPSLELAPSQLNNFSIPREIIHTVLDTNTKYSHELISNANDVVIGMKNEYQPQQNSSLRADGNDFDTKRTTEMYNRNKTDTTTVKESLLLAEKNVNENNIKQTEHAENISTKGYLQYQAQTKILNINSNFTTVEKSLERQHILQNNVSIIKNLKPNYNRKEYQHDNNTLQYLQDYAATIGLASLENSTSNIVKQNLPTQLVEIMYQSNENPHLPKVKENDTKMNLYKNKFKSHEMKKVRLENKRKHKLKKVLSTIHNKKEKDEKTLVTEYIDNVNISDKINNTKNLKSFLKKLLSGFKFNKHANKQSNVRKFKIIQYLQLFFKNIFGENKRHKKYKTITTKINKKTVIETLCSTFGPCNHNIKNKAKLQSQLDHLNSETYKMLRIIKKIKGLLELIDLSSQDKKLSNNTFFRNDVQKLHAILKDAHGEQFKNLTPTQKLQIGYIKNNTQDFIRAAAKFSMTLNEIINIITVHKDVNINLDRYKSRVEINDMNSTNQVIKLRNSNRTITLTESNESLQKLKELISRYSLLQNTFMRKIYNVLTNLDSSKDSSTKESSIANSSAAVKTNVQNKTEEIQVYTKNIIQNLRKLKNLAQNLNGNTRRKRDIGYDETLEYLLMLMEFLIKQKSPLDPPVNDGIDLLLEAIKSAPDIKDIKKMPPSYSPLKKLDSMRKSETLLDMPPKENLWQISQENNSTSDSKSSKEDKFSSSSSNSEDPAFNAINKSFDDDDDEKDYNLFGSKNILPPTTEVTYKSSTKETPNIHTPHCTMESHITTKIDQKVNNQGNRIEENSNNEFSNKFVEYDISPTNIVTDIEYTSAATTIVEKTSSSTEIAPYFKVNDDVSASQSRLDWIDESYEEETKENSTSTTEKSTQMPKLENFDHVETHNMTNKFFTKEAKRSHDVSKLSKEIEDLTSKTKMKEILYKKQLDFLNSLDYGNGKMDPDMSASRESGMIDKYTGDIIGR